MTRVWNRHAAIKSLLPITALLFLLLFGVGQARADTITIDLNSPNTGISAFPGPYGTVTVNRTSTTTATITFAGADSAAEDYLFGGNGAANVNVNATTFTLSGLSGSADDTGFTSGPLSDGGSKNANGFGNFNLTIDSFDGFATSSETITFTLTNTSGSWATASDVLTQNADTAEVAAHIFVCGTTSLDVGCDASNGALATGYAAGSGTEALVPDIPEPGSLLLLGTGLVGLATGLRRRRRTTA